ncbi:anti-phage dCTP deaminase [Thioclava sp. GXIMD4215]|uniref:anti-phage dCTP deaminase n=1 Tax=Thioclava sp. GXIMD4215 TaxID=3131928 RepID=UPI003255BE5C
MNISNAVNRLNFNSEDVQPELIFGLVGPLGSDIDAVQDALKRELQKVEYNVVDIHLTKDVVNVIPALKGMPTSTYQQKIDLMNDLARFSQKNDFLARVAIMMIATHRNRINAVRSRETGEDYSKEQAEKTAFIIRQLKRPAEIALLNKVYGKKFIQISIAVSEEDQLQSVLNIIGRESPEFSQVKREEAARRLIGQDREETGVDYGQSTTNAHQSGDVFVAGRSKFIFTEIARFIDALFGSNYVSPTRDEFGSQLAKTASLRTLDLSRQVGAAITTADGDVITLGCNEVPKAGGGSYWCDDDNPQRDMERGVEPNKLETNRIVNNFIHALHNSDLLKKGPKEIFQDERFKDLLKDAFVSDLTEFGRITHAEMSALTDAARLGLSTKGATIYVTTFPCHNCAKHLIAAGIKRIVYIEPYTKSKAFELSGDALTTSKSDIGKVLVEHFVGIAPKRYQDIFEKKNKRRTDANVVNRWYARRPLPLVSDVSKAHLHVEETVKLEFPDVKKRVEHELMRQALKLLQHVRNCCNHKVSHEQ